MGGPQLLVVVLCGILVVAAVIALVVATRPDHVARAAERRAEWTGLPLPNGAIADAVRRRLRLSAAVSCVGLVIVAVVATMVALTPAGVAPRYFLLVAPFVFIAVIGGTTAVTVSRPLFRPDAGARRVARSSSRQVADYVGPFRRALPWAATAVAGSWVAVMSISGEAALPGAVILAVAAAGLCALPWIDSVVIGAPQPASHSLELVWDDAFRADALGGTRATICALALIGALLAPTTTWSWAPLLLNVAIVAITAIYARAPLRAALRPPWLAVAMAGRR